MEEVCSSSPLCISKAGLGVMVVDGAGDDSGVQGGMGC